MYLQIFYSVLFLINLIRDLRETHTNPVVAYDCMTKEECCFRIFQNAAPADNPMQSELCSHIGAQGNKNCRRCKVGGNKEFRETAEGFHSLFSVRVLFAPVL